MYGCWLQSMTAACVNEALAGCGCSGVPVIV